MIPKHVLQSVLALHDNAPVTYTDIELPSTDNAKVTYGNIKAILTVLSGNNLNKQFHVTFETEDSYFTAYYWPDTQVIGVDEHFSYGTNYQAISPGDTFRFDNDESPIANFAIAADQAGICDLELA